MNTVKINELKARVEAAAKAHDDEKARLAALGYKSQERYFLLKPLKKVLDDLNAEYVKFAHGQIKGELNKIIAADRPARQAAARARSPWKQAKYAAKKAMVQS